MADRRRCGAEGPANGNSSGSSSSHHSSSSSAKLVIENASAAIAAASKQLSKADLPLLFSLLNDEATLVAHRMMREVESATSYRDAVIGHRSSSSNNNDREQKMGESKRAREGDGSQQRSGSSHGNGHDGWSAPVPTARERYLQRIEKQKQRFPQRPIHSRVDYNPSACQPGCFYHEEDQNKHDHREVRGWDDRWYKRGILRYPAAAKPAPALQPSPQRTNNSSSSSSSGSSSSNSTGSPVHDAPPLDPNWHEVPMSTEMGLAIAKHNSMRDSMAPEEKEEAKDSTQQQHHQPQRLPPATRLPVILRRPSRMPPTPPPQTGKRQPTSPDSPQEPPKKHQPGHSDDHGRLALPLPVAAAADLASDSLSSQRLPLPALLVSDSLLPSTTVPPHSAESLPLYV